MSVANHSDIADVCAFVNFHGITPSTEDHAGDRRARLSGRARLGNLLICESLLRRAHNENEEDSL